MEKIKEKPKTGKARGGKAPSQPALTQRQAAKLMVDKYRRQLDQRPDGSEGQAEYATEQVETSGQLAVDEIAAHARPHTPRQRDRQIKEKPRDEQPPPDQPAPAPGREEAPPQHERPANAPKEKGAPSVQSNPAGQGAAYTGQATASPTPAAQPQRRTYKIKERPAVEIKSAARLDTPLIKERPSPLIHPSIKSIPSADPQSPGRPGEHTAQQLEAAPTMTQPPTSKRAGRPAAPGRSAAPPAGDAAVPGKYAPAEATPRQRALNSARQKLNASRHSAPTADPVSSTPDLNAGTPGPGRQAPKVRTGAKATAPKVRGSVYPKGLSAPKAARDPFKTAVRPLRTAKQTVRQRMTQQAVKQTAKQAGNAARKSALMLKRAVQAVAKATAVLVSSLAALAGSGILLIALVVVIVIAAVASSPFGLFFAEERTAQDAVSVAEAVSSVNMAYNGRLELIQAGTYDSIDLTGTAPDWPDVLAVFAARYAGVENGVDVATLDTDRVDKLTSVFWDMTTVTSTAETIDHPDSDPDDDVDDSWTENILHITVTAKTADDMRTFYAFTEYQNSALDELLSDRAALSALAGSLNIVNVDALDVLASLPNDLSQERREVVQTALKLYGKVNYFWGGKSRVIGWDSRWGQLMKVTAEGSTTTGTYRPFGLDCSGFADWVFYNASGGSYIIGHGGGAASQHTYCTAVTWAEAQPGDLVFYPEDEHVGIVCGRDESGGLLVIHCASSYNNVVITGISGFTSIGRPLYYNE